MLSEFWHYISTPCPRPVRKMGYLSESIAISARKKRQKEAWKPHLQKCHQVIRAAASECRPHNLLVILGGGLAYDLPIRFLAGTFKEIVLVDILFTKHTKNSVRKYNNISLLQADATGVVEKSYRKPKILAQPKTHPLLEELLGRASLVISANIWSQLPMMPIKRVERYHRYHELHAWSEKIMAHHLQQLRSVNGDVCLISDMTSIEKDREGNSIDEYPLIPETLLPAWEKHWEWHIAPAPEVDKHRDIYHTVGAITKKESLPCLLPSMESEIAIP
jgi:hypothetical protein